MIRRPAGEEAVRLSLSEVVRSGVPPAEPSADPHVADLVAVVELDGVGAVHSPALDRALRASGRILVGVAAAPLPAAVEELLPALDVVVAPGGAGRAVVAVPDPEAALSRLTSAIDIAPRAAYTLVGTLRAVAALPLAEAFAVESAAYSLLLGGPEFARWLRRRPVPSAASAPAASVRVSREASILRVVLARPERRNAFSRAMRDELVEALRLAELDDSIAAVELSGEGPCFSSGGDLGEFGTAPDIATAHVVRILQSPARLLVSLSARVTAVVHGACVGAGVELPSFADAVVAAPGTTFALPELAMGLLPGAGGTVGVARRIGRWRTAWLALTGATLDIATARAWGLVDEIRGR